MTERFLEITYHAGKPLAAYLYLPRRPGDVSVRTQLAGAGLVIDRVADGRAIGLEFTVPWRITVDEVNRALALAGQEPATEQELAPLLRLCHDTEAPPS